MIRALIRRWKKSGEPCSTFDVDGRGGSGEKIRPWGLTNGPGGSFHNRAEPSRAEPSRAEPSRAERRP